MDTKRGWLKRGIRSGAIVLLAALPAACWLNDDSDKDAPLDRRVPLVALKLAPMKSCEAYKAYVANALVERYTPSGWNGGEIMQPNGEGSVASPSLAPGTDATSGNAESAPDHVTGTNNQEPGVDEADIVKTDALGTLYIAHGTTLRIVRGHPPAELAELAALDVGAEINSLHLDDAHARLVVFATAWIAPPVVQPLPLADAAMMIAPPYYRYKPRYRAVFIDVADKTHPTIVTQLEFDGEPRATRRIDNRIHAVMTNAIDLPAALNDSESFWKLFWSYHSARDADAAAAIAAQVKTEILAAVAAADATEFLPRVTTTRNGTSTTAPLVGCTAIQAPQVLSYPSLVTVASFDTDAANLATTAITAHAAVVYASAGNLYITQSSGNWWSADANVPQTGIHQFAIDGAAPVYQASGLVDGQIPDPFAMSEHDGDLRVVTHTDFWRTNTRVATNDLFILAPNGAGELNVRGSVRDFGRNENLFSVRFIGTRGFAVTFRQIDPLFAFDLSDPDAPALRGELTIPGFSTYMHPLGDTHLLTLGVDGNGQVQLQIFDVSDLSRPTQAHTFSPVLPGPGYTWSSAAYDHHAFTFDDTTGTLAIPLAYSSYSGDAFNGILALDVDTTNGFREIVRVDHDDLLPKDKTCNTLSPLLAACGHSWTDAFARRAVLMTEGEATTLYTISNAGVKATDLAPPNPTLGSVAFPPIVYPLQPLPGPAIGQ